MEADHTSPWFSSQGTRRSISSAWDFGPYLHNAQLLLHALLRQTQQRFLFPYDAVDDPTNILQNGTDGRDAVFAVASGDDGSVVLAGYTAGSSGETQMASLDFAAVKLGVNGTEEWRWQVNKKYDTVEGKGVPIRLDGSSLCPPPSPLRFPWFSLLPFALDTAVSIEN